MFLKVTEVKTGRTAETLFLEGTESEIYRLVKSLSIKENKIVAKHAPKDSVKNRLTIMNYLSRGFTLPLEVRLDDMFHS